MKVKRLFLLTQIKPLVDLIFKKPTRLGPNAENESTEMLKAIDPKFQFNKIGIM